MTKQELTLMIDIGMILRQAIFIPIELVDHKRKYNLDAFKKDHEALVESGDGASLAKAYNEKAYAILNLGHHFHECGYHLHPDAYEYMMMLPDSYLQEYLDTVRVTFDNINGFDLTYKTFFGNGRMASEVEADGDDPYRYAVMHYFSSHFADLGLYPVVDATGNPIDYYSKENDVKKPFTDMELDEVASLMGPTPDGMKVLRLVIGNDEIARCVGNLLESNSPLSESLADLVVSFYKDVILPCPESELWYYKNFYTTKIACKETLALVLNTVHDAKGDISLFAHNINNATDVLRFYAVLSGCDSSLKPLPRFKRLTSYERKMMMKLLNECPHLDTDVWSYPELWKRAFERIHPHSTCRRSKKYDHIRDVAVDLYNKNKPKTVNSLVENVLTKQPENLDDVLRDIKFFEKFPSQFAAHFDFAVRRYGKKLSNEIQDNIEYSKVINQALMTILRNVPSTRLILRLFSYYGSRMTRMAQKKTRPPRVVKVKGATEYTLLPSVKDPICSSEYLLRFYGNILNRIHCELVRRFMDLPYLGNIFIDPFAASCVVPMELREANDMGMRFLGRGSTFPIRYSQLSGRNLIIVPFIHWTNPENGQRTDIDLSVGFMDNHFALKNNVSYRNLVLKTSSGDKIVATHSGDYTDGGPYDGEGVSEFVICRLNAARAQGYRYVVIQIHDYTQQSFKNKNTFFGLQLLQENAEDSGIEVLEGQRTFDRKLKVGLNPDSVVLTSNIQSSGDYNIPVLIDLQEELLYWVDISTNMTAMQGNIIHLEDSKTCTVYKMREDTYIDAYVEGTANPDISMDKYNNGVWQQKMLEGTCFRDLIRPEGNNIQNCSTSTMVQMKALMNKPYVFMGDLLRIHAQARGDLVQNPAEANIIFTVPESEYAKNMRDDQELLTPFMVDRWINEFMMVHDHDGPME